MIGIIIVISSVIVLVGMGSGSTKQITSQVQSLGTNLISANTSSNGNKQFTLDNVKDIEQIEGVDLETFEIYYYLLLIQRYYLLLLNFPCQL